MRGDEPAFPTPNVHLPYNPGMTLRDWFAGRALTGIFITEPTDGRGCGDDWPAVAAEAAYRAADAMLAEREKSR